jgi:hypothetical protein
MSPAVPCCCVLVCWQWKHRDWDQLTAVIAAASSGHLDMVKFLIDSGADVNAKDKVWVGVGVCGWVGGWACLPSLACK